MQIDMYKMIIQNHSVLLVHMNNIMPTSVLLILEWTNVVSFECVKMAESAGLDPDPKNI